MGGKKTHEMGPLCQMKEKVPVSLPLEGWKGSGIARRIARERPVKGGKEKKVPSQQGQLLSNYEGEKPFIWGKLGGIANACERHAKSCPDVV